MTLFKFFHPPLTGCTLKINLDEFDSIMDLVSDCVKKTNILLDNLNLEYLCAFLHNNQFYLKTNLAYIKDNPNEIQYIYTLELP
ncbi:MAG: hypothetical protein CMB64_04015 [Euryarchaeota archaeon]|nr:hypothetical protein [Euryarchaeota archaeon]